jgi:hypothetical protein
MSGVPVSPILMALRSDCSRLARNVEVVVLGRGDIRIVLELLDVDDGDLGRAAVVAGSDIGLDVAGKRFAAVDDVDVRPHMRNSSRACLSKFSRSTMK